MKREILEIEDCPDCGAKPGEVHADGCDIELCSECGLQKIGCNHKGDKKFHGGLVSIRVQQKRFPLDSSQNLDMQT